MQDNALFLFLEYEVNRQNQERESDYVVQSEGLGLEKGQSEDGEHR